METVEENQENMDLVNGQREITLTTSGNSNEADQDNAEPHSEIKLSPKNSLTKNNGMHNASKMSERHGEKLSNVKTDEEESPPEKLVPTEMLRHVVTIPIQKMEEGDDLGIYDDPGESGEDLEDLERGNKSSPISTVEKPKIPPPILRNSAAPKHTDVLENENVGYSENVVNFREDMVLTDENSNRVTWSAIHNHYDEERHLSGIRGKANTPASLYTDFSLDSR